MPKILKPNEVTLDQLDTDQKLIVAIQLMQTNLQMLNEFQQAMINQLPCATCGTKPPSAIRCAVCAAKEMEEAAKTAKMETN